MRPVRDRVVEQVARDRDLRSVDRLQGRLETLGERDPDSLASASTSRTPVHNGSSGRCARSSSSKETRSETEDECTSALLSDSEANLVPSLTSADSVANCSAGTVVQRCSSSIRTSRPSHPHGPNATGHRGWNGQPIGAAAASGISPRGSSRGTVREGSGSGTAPSSAFVYGWRGLVKISATGPISTILPRYMMAMRSQKNRADARSCVM